MYQFYGAQFAVFEWICSFDDYFDWFLDCCWLLVLGAGRCQNGDHSGVKLTHKLWQTVTNNWRPSQLPGKILYTNNNITMELIISCLKPYPHCHRKVRLSQKMVRQRRNSATVSLSATNCRTFLRQCGQAFSCYNICNSSYLCLYLVKSYRSLIALILSVIFTYFDILAT